MPIPEIHIPREATIVVAASDSLTPSGDYVCDGVDDHVQILAALAALPATGGTVMLLEGTYNCEASIAMTSYDRLVGNGRGTILTTTTANLDIITAVGGGGTEIIGIEIANLTVDGTAGAAVNDMGIYWDFVDYSSIHHVWSINNGEEGIHIKNSDWNRIQSSVTETNGTTGGIELESSNFNVVNDNISAYNTEAGIRIVGQGNSITGNTCHDNTQEGIEVTGVAQGNGIAGNTCYDNNHGIKLSGATVNDNGVVGNGCYSNAWYGIFVDSALFNTFSGNGVSLNGRTGIFLTDSAHMNILDGNQVRRNGYHGIHIQDSEDNLVSNNLCAENSFATNITYDNIFLDGASDRNNIQCNTCRIGAQAQRARYGINVSVNTCNDNIVKGNDLLTAGVTANFNDAGTNTKLASIVIPFVDGTAATPTGFDVDAEAEYAYAFGSMPAVALEVVRIKIRGRAITVDGANEMVLDIDIGGGADNENYNAENYSADDIPSDTIPSANDDIVQWTVTNAGVCGSGGLSSGDSFYISAIGAPAAAPDLATDCHFQSVIIEYI